MSSVHSNPNIMMFNDTYTVLAARNERLQNLATIMVNGSPVCKIDYIASIQIHSTHYFNVYRRYNNVYEIIVEDYRGEFHVFKDMPLRDIIASILCLPVCEYYSMSVLTAYSYGHNSPIYSDFVINAPVSHIHSHYNGISVNLQGVLLDYKASCDYCSDLLSANMQQEQQQEEQQQEEDYDGWYTDELPPLIPINPVEPKTPVENKVVAPKTMPSPIKVCPDTMMFLDLSAAKDLNDAFIASSIKEEDDKGEYEADDEGLDEFIAEITRIINRPIVPLKVSIPEPTKPITRAAADKKEMSMRHSDVKKQKQKQKRDKKKQDKPASVTNADKSKKRKREASPSADEEERKFYNLRKRKH